MQDFLHSFPTQEQNEPVFIFARPYWIAFVPTALIFIFILLFSFLAQIALVTSFVMELSPDFILGSLLFLGIFQLITLVVFTVAIFDFYFDLIIVTDRRLVDINQEQLFQRRISELTLSDIQDASSETKGIFPTIFGYGTIEIQTAGARDNFCMRNLRYPYELRALILDLAEQAHEGKPEGTRWPETKTVAVINNRILHTPQELEDFGAILPQDLQRAPHNEPQ